MDPDIEDLTHLMVNHLRSKHRDISLDFIVQNDDFGKHSVIIYAEYSFNPMGFDFIESRTSWKRPEAVNEYNTLVEDGYCVVVYAPNDQIADVRAIIKTKKGRSNIRLFSYDKILSPRRPTDDLAKTNHSEVRNEDSCNSL